MNVIMNIFRCNRSGVRRRAVMVLMLMIVSLGTGFVLTGADVPGGSPGGKALVIDPGKVQFSISQNGGWLGFVPRWSPERSMFTRGGFVLFADGRDGAVVEVTRLLDPAPPGLVPVFWCEDVYEGIPGGNRHPAPNPDDDRDGKTDEDRLDGIDNDGDGSLDEDFRAIGDKMAVVETAYQPADTTLRLIFHQECYAWSLPNIENMVMIRLFVLNSGSRTLRNVRLGTFLRVAGPQRCVSSTIESALLSPAVPATILQCSGTEDVHFALALLGHSAGAGEEWLSGCLDAPKQAVARIVQAQTAAGTVFGERPETAADDGTFWIDNNRQKTIYGITPAIGTLAPGEEARIDIALLATRTSEKMESAIVDAYKTYAGDGTNRFLPPPVFLTRRTLWGSFEPLEAPQKGILVTIENARAEGMTPDHLAFLRDMPKQDIEIVDASGRDLVFVYRGAIDDEIQDGTGRIVLKARVTSGEIFEVTLRPGGERPVTVSPNELTKRQAMEYWEHSGKLDEQLLSSSPNPFRESAIIFFEVPSLVEDENGNEIAYEGPFETSVKVYNVSGQLVSILADWVMGPGGYNEEWNGIDDNGNPVASGVYYVKLQIEKRHITKRLTLVR